MNKATEWLRAAGTFYVATVEGDQPRVRPFGAVAEINGKTYMTLNNQKKVYKQFKANPKVEICGMVDGNWFRVWAKVVEDDNLASRVEAIAQNESLGGMYKADDGLFTVFYLDDVHGKLEGFGGAIEEF